MKVLAMLIASVLNLLVFGNVWAHGALLGDPDVKAHVDALAVAPYFGLEWGDEKNIKNVVNHDVDWLLSGLERIQVCTSYRGGEDDQRGRRGGNVQ